MTTYGCELISRADGAECIVGQHRPSPFGFELRKSQWLGGENVPPSLLGFATPVVADSFSCLAVRARLLSAHCILPRPSCRSRRALCLAVSGFANVMHVSGKRVVCVGRLLARATNCRSAPLLSGASRLACAANGFLFWLPIVTEWSLSVSLSFSCPRGHEEDVAAELASRSSGAFVASS